MRNRPALSICGLMWMALCVPPQGTDSFVEQHARGIAANTTRGFSIRFKDGRTVFNPREPIRVELVYEHPVEMSVTTVDGMHASYYAHPVFDRPVANPLEVIDPRFDDSVPGGVTCSVRYESQPAVLQATLNGPYRFDAPGHYRMFFHSRHVTREPETSNILEFDVLPRDASWEAQVLERARKTLLESQESEPRAQAFADLRALATNDATALLAPHVLTDGGYDALYGVFANSDRAAVVTALAAELARPERTVHWQFIPYLAQLELVRRHPAGPPFSHDEYLEITRDFTIARARALKTIPGRLEAELRLELERPSRDHDFVRGITAAARAFPRETIAVLQSLPPQAQRNHLLGSWRRFNDPVFLPFLRSAYASPSGGDAELRDIALRRLYERAPEEGRAAMLTELRRRRPGVTIETLGVLPERAFPQYEAQWARWLNTSSDEYERTAAAQRLERFGTGRVAASVKRFYRRADRTMSCATRSAVLAYLARVDGAFAERQIAIDSTTGKWDETCSDSVLVNTAELEWTPAVERAAIAVLRDARPEVVQLAVQVLGEHGSAAARQPLESRFAEIVRQVDAALRSGVPSSDRALEELQRTERMLARSLVDAKSWMLTCAERDAFAARCPAGHDCRQEFLFGAIVEPVDSAWARPRLGHERELEFRVNGYYGRSLDGLEEKLRQFPSGTKVFWADRPLGFDDSLERWTWSERDELFERVRRDIAPSGVIVQRERRLLSSYQTACGQSLDRPSSGPTGACSTR